MARMPTADQLLAAAKATGFPVVEMSGWRGRCRCHNTPHSNGPKVRSFGPWYGTTIHQTAGPRLTGQAAINYVRNILIAGNGITPGPLSQYGIGGDGTIYMVAVGRCNHIGRISPASLTAMRNASFSLAGNHNIRGSGVDGNTHTVGFELLMNGSTLRDTASDPQRTAAVRLAAELARIAGWSGRETHGHGEVSIDRGFSDPGYNMGRFRRDVMTHVSRGPTRRPQSVEAEAGTTPRVTRPSNQTQEEDMPLDSNDKAAIRAIVREEAGWSRPVRRDGQEISAIQELADTKTLITQVLGRVGHVRRGGEEISIRQEIADTKTLLIAQEGRIAGLTAALHQVAAGNGLDAATVERAVHTAVSAALAGLQADVTLTIEPTTFATTNPDQEEEDSR